MKERSPAFAGASLPKQGRIAPALSHQLGPTSQCISGGQPQIGSTTDAEFHNLLQLSGLDEFHAWMDTAIRDHCGLALFLALGKTLQRKSATTYDRSVPGRHGVLSAAITGAAETRPHADPGS